MFWRNGWKARCFEMSWKISCCRRERKIIAISGIVDKSDSLYNGYEISWTCCEEEYRHRGIVTNILKQCIEKLPNDGIPLYCDCWRINFNDKINLHSTMKNLGMKLFFVNVAVYNKDYTSVCKTCPYRNDSEKCHCVVDLYKKDRWNENHSWFHCWFH